MHAWCAAKPLGLADGEGKKKKKFFSFSPKQTFHPVRRQTWTKEFLIPDSHRRVRGEEGNLSENRGQQSATGLGCGQERVCARKSA